MLSLPCTVYDRILLCLFLVFLTLFWAFLSFQIHPSYFDKRQIQTVKQILAYLVSHLDEKVSLESLVRQAHMNQSTFYSVFAHIYGESPYSYLKRYKMNLAAQWLLESKMKVSDIALRLGYSNASKFSRAFFSVYGILPKDYRKKD